MAESNNIEYLPVSVDQETEAGLSGFWILTPAAVLLGAAVIPWFGWGRIRFQAHSVVIGRIQFLAGIETKGSVLLAVGMRLPSVRYHMGLSMGQLRNMVAGFIRVSKERAREGE